MLVPVPLFAGIPGGPELLVILLVFFLFLGLPLLLVVAGVVGGVKLLGRSEESGEANDAKQQRVEKLERRVAELEREQAEDRVTDRGRDSG